MEILRGLTREQAIAVTGCPLHVRVHAGELVFQEGEPASGLFVVAQGRVEIYREAPEGRVVIGTVGPHEVFGEVGLILEDGRRTASARALEPTLLMGIPGDHRQMLERIGDVKAAIRLMENLICLLGKRLRQNNEQQASGERRAPPILHADSPGQKEALAILARALPQHGLFKKAIEKRELKAREFLCHEGEEPNGFYFLHQGTLEVWREQPQRPPRMIARLAAPNVAGELGFFSGEKRSASLRAACDVVYTLFSGKDFESLRKGDEPAALHVLLAAAQMIVHLFVESGAPVPQPAASAAG